MPYKINLFQYKDLRQDVSVGGSSSSWQKFVYLRICLPIALTCWLQAGVFACPPKPRLRPAGLA
jgi:hypothetical protein